jgi:FtsZ-interacting cell division protein ZipA
MNKKKIIIGLVIAGVVVAGGIYLYRRNKKSTSEKNTDTDASKRVENPQVEMATEKDATDIVDLINKRDTPYSAEKTKAFVDLYVKNISKENHEKIKAILTTKTKESDWTSQDKLIMLELITKVTNKMKRTEGKAI